MKFVYFGSFRISADILEQLVARGFVPSAVICSPDKPAGRKKIITAPDIKKLIIEKNWPIEIYQPEKLEIQNLKLEIGEVDLAIVMGYPQIIPESVLKIPRLGTIGVHPSLLPKYRGPSPIQSAILAGETETGVTLYLIDAKMDHGPILAKTEIRIKNDETNLSLEEECSDVAAKLLLEILPKYLAGEIKLIEQDHAQATITKKFTSADGEVNFVKDDPLSVYRKIKAFYPEPGVWTLNFPGYANKRVKLLSAQWSAEHPEHREGSNPLHITAIQPDGKKPIRIL